MDTIRALAKGQVVIPAAVRRRFGINAGSLLGFRVVDNHMELHVLPVDPIQALHGVLAGGESLAGGLEEEHRTSVLAEA